jgi:hypothetical protein
VAWADGPSRLDVVEASKLMRKVAAEYGGDFMGHGGISSSGLRE